LVAAILALLAMIYRCPVHPALSLHGSSISGVQPDLFNAFYQANHAGLMAGQLGATYFIPTFIVPLLLITHGLGFRILLGHEKESVTNKIRRPAQGAVGQF
jgi:hypothetical protein